MRSHAIYNVPDKFSAATVQMLKAAAHALAQAATQFVQLSTVPLTATRLSAAARQRSLCRSASCSHLGEALPSTGAVGGDGGSTAKTPSFAEAVLVAVGNRGRLPDDSAYDCWVALPQVERGSTRG